MHLPEGTNPNWGRCHKRIRNSIPVNMIDPLTVVAAYNSATRNRREPGRREKYRHYLTFRKGIGWQPIRQERAAKHLLMWLQASKEQRRPVDIDEDTLAFELMTAIDPEEAVASEVANWLLDRHPRFDTTIDLYCQYIALRGKRNSVAALFRSQLRLLARSDDEQ